MRRLVYLTLFCLLTGCADKRPAPIQATGNAIARAQSRNESIQQHAGEAMKRSRGEQRYHVQSIQVDAKAQARDLAEGQADLAKLAKQFASALAESTKSLRTVQALCLIVVGVSVAIGLLLHQTRLSVVGVVSALATAATAQALITFDSASFGGKFWMFVFGIAGVCGLWFVLDVIFRGSFKAAVKTSPRDDIRDLAAALREMTQAEGAPGATA
jgi:hypothetical protein